MTLLWAKPFSLSLVDGDEMSICGLEAGMGSFANFYLSNPLFINGVNL